MRRVFTASGQVQGVGFRPFVWRLAREEGLTGSVRNTADGVRIEAQGAPRAVATFGRRLRAELPPLARLTGVDEAELAPMPGEAEFRILQSEGAAAHTVLVSPDVAVCPDCLADMRDPANRRFGYAFTNCTNCGPRFTITRSIPYDRAVTSMACFPLCPDCAAEYGNPADRRFHAQPIACPACGPRLWFVDAAAAARGPEMTGPTPENEADALARAGQLLLDGGILALKGLGGFQLLCNARDEKAVEELRRRK
ncbi:acylphosphatase, partial [Desulfovibrio sp.]|uniref:acylphosphatase n=1 Tax=Desulfovibrio sp. TaxID=885 RepID=UPI00344D4639